MLRVTNSMNAGIPITRTNKKAANLLGLLLFTMVRGLIPARYGSVYPLIVAVLFLFEFSRLFFLSGFRRLFLSLFFSVL